MKKRTESLAFEAAPKFPLGSVCTTAGALTKLDGQEVRTAIERHRRGDWGNVCAEGRKENEFSLKNGFRLLSSYQSADGVSFWIITEHDRSVTTVLLPEEY